MQSKTYISYWPDLQQAFGSKFNSWKKAQDHWESNGYNEGRAYQIEGATEPSNCADEGGVCNCMGDITYGIKKNSDDPEIAKSLPRATFEEVLQWNSVTIDGRNGADVACTNDVFGDPLSGYQKQCYCEAAARRIPTRIALEGEKPKVQKKGKPVSQGCWADGGSGDGGSKDGNKRGVPEMVSSGKGCGQEGMDRCQAAAEAKGFNTFSMQWPEGNC
jgi:hypothetical protein